MVGPFDDLAGKMPNKPSETLIDRYSFTGDILSYKRCSKQYGTFSHYRFTKALPIQAWFGDVVHMTIERLFRQTRGEIENEQKIMASDVAPNDADVIYHCEEVIEILKSRGMFARHSDQESVKGLLKIFNSTQGLPYYQRIQESEVRLETIINPDGSSMPYILNGIVDVLISLDDDTLEIWDYKAMDRPDSSIPAEADKLEDLENQMYTYVDIVQALFPDKTLSCAVLYFVNELAPGGGGNPEYRIDLSDSSVQQSIEDARNDANAIVDEIRRCKISGIFPLPKKGEVDKKTCDACEWRWKCPSTIKTYKFTAP